MWLTVAKARFCRCAHAAKENFDGQLRPYLVRRRLRVLGSGRPRDGTEWYGAFAIQLPSVLRLTLPNIAISTLLQPPIVRTGLVAHTSASAFASAHKPPTARDIPPVTLTNIPHVDAAEFRPYLTQVGALYEQLRRVRENEDDGPSGLRRRGASRQDEVADLLDDNLKAGSVRSGGSAARKASIASLALLSSPIDAPSPVSRTGSGRRSTQGPPPLSTVPAVYFDEDFHLENPRIFDVVSERSEVVRKGPVVAADEKTGTSNGSAAAPRKALATNAILQEKLSWYMDTIEMHLISSISTASTTFFTALGSLRELHSEAADSVERIRTLRKELSALDEEIAARGLGILQKKRRRENLQQLNDAVVQLKMIVESVRSTEALVDAGEVEQALTSIDGLEQLIAGERSSAESGGPMPRLRDLRGATALQSVNGDLDTLRFRIGKAYESKFIGMLLSDLRRHSESVSTREVLLRWSSAAMRARGGHAREASAFPAYMGSVDELRSSLVPILTGLRRARHISVAASSYREAVLREIRNAIRRPLPSSSDDDNESMMSSSTLGGSGRLSQQEKSSILARNLRALEPEDAEELLVKIYVGITETLRRLTTQVKVLLDVASSMGQPALSSGMKSPPLRSPPPTNTAADADGLEMQEEIHKALDMANLLGQAVDVAQDKVVRILRVRAEQSKSLSLAWFLRYFTLNLYFANECEAISGRSGTALKTVVNGHIKDFVQQHGEAERQKLAAGMEADQWTAKDFSEQDTVLLNRILGCSTRDAAEWSSGSKIWLPYEDADANGPSAPAAADSNGTGRERVRPAIIDDEQYMLTQSAVLGLQGIARFLELACSIPSMTTDVSNSLIAYLHLFNSRCTQLILGAGATKSAGLKNINTRHLALASQALGFIATLIPHIREFARRHAGVGPPAATLMSDFDKVRRLYQEHQNSIYDKLVEIMSGRAVAQSKALKALIWDEEGPAGANAYMEVLVKDTITLHKVLQKLLPEGTVLMIMMPVFASYKDHFTRAYQSVDPKTAAGLAR